MTKTCADIHRELFPTYEALLAECCAKEAALIEADRYLGKDTTDLYLRAAERWGTKAQLRMAQEEAGELVAAVSHYLRGRLGSAMLAGEIADVLITAGQARLIIGSAMVDHLVSMKLRRLEQRVAEAEEKAVAHG